MPMDELLSRLLKLSVQERHELARALIESLDGSQESAEARDVLEKRWGINADRKKRSALAGALFDSLDEESFESEEDLGPGWSDEMARRIEQIDNGTVKTIPAEEFWESMERRWGIKITP